MVENARSTAKQRYTTPGLEVLTPIDAEGGKAPQTNEGQNGRTNTGPS